MKAKRVLSLILAAVMLIGLLPSIALAGNANVITYTFNRTAVGSSADIYLEKVGVDGGSWEGLNWRYVAMLNINNRKLYRAQQKISIRTDTASRGGYGAVVFEIDVNKGGTYTPSITYVPHADSKDVKVYILPKSALGDTINTAAYEKLYTECTPLGGKADDISTATNGSENFTHTYDDITLEAGSCYLAFLMESDDTATGYQVNFSEIALTEKPDPFATPGVKVKYDISGYITENMTGGYGDDLNDFTFASTKGAFRYVSSSDADGVTDSASVRTRPEKIIQLSSGKNIAFEVYVPRPGTYKMNMYNGLQTGGSVVEVFKSTSAASTAAADKIGEYNTNNDGTATNWVPVITPNVIENIEIAEAGYYVFTFKSAKSYGTVGTFELVSGDGSETALMPISVSSDKAELQVRDTAALSVSVYDSIGKAVNNAAITFESLTPSTASVSADGVVTALSEGEIKIKATAKHGEDTQSAEYFLTAAGLPELPTSNVKIVYDVEGFVKEYFTGEYGDDFNTMTANATRGAFSYYASSDADGISDAAVLRARPTGVVQAQSGKFIALEVYIPKAGTYTMNMYNGLYTSGGEMEVFLGEEKVGSYNCKHDGDAENWAPVKTPNVIEGIRVEEPGYYILRFNAVGGYGTIGKFELVNGDGSKTALMPPVLADFRKVLTVGDEEFVGATVYNSVGYEATDALFSHIPLTFPTANVDINGLVTANAPGFAKFVVEAWNDSDRVKTRYEIRVDSANKAGYSAVYDFKRDFAYQTPINDLTYADTENFWGFVAQNGDKSLKIHNSYGIHALTTGASHWFALKINVPASGDYFMSLQHAHRATGAIGEVYVLPSDTEQTKDAIAEALTEVSPVGEVNYEGEDNNAVITELGNVTLAKGDNIVVFKVKAKGSQNAYMLPGAIILDGGEKVALMDISLTTATGLVNVTGKMSDDSISNLSDATVIFTSSDKKIATVNAAGVITDNALGSVEITADVTRDGVNIKKSIRYEVTNPPVPYGGVDVVYDFSSWKGTWTRELSLAAGFKGKGDDDTYGSPLRDARGITYEHTPGNWEWRGVGDTKGFNNWTTTVDSTFRLYNGTGSYIRLTKAGRYIAFNIKVPKAGKYSARLDRLIRSSDEKDVSVYILPGSIESGKIHENLTEENFVSKVSFYTDGENSTDEVRLGNVTFDEAGEYILVFRLDSVTKDGYFRVKTLTLDGINCIREVTATIDKDDLLYGDTAKITVSPSLLDGTEPEEGSYDVSFRSSFSDVVDVDEDGTVYAVGDGDTVITVKVSDKHNTVEKQINVHATDNTPVVGTELIVHPNIFVRGAERLDWRVTMQSGNVLKVPFDTVSYTYSEEGIVTADEKGKVYGVAPGTVDVTLSAVFHGVEITDTVTLNVNEPKGKSEPTYYTYEKRENAKKNIARYAWAKSELNSTLKKADVIVENYEAIYNGLTGEGIPRAYRVGLLNCPEYQQCKWCGKNLDVDGNGWTFNMAKDPWKVQCSNCKRRFPTNDFALLYSRGVDEKGFYDRDRALENNRIAVENGEADALVNVLYPELSSGINIGRGLRDGETVETWGVDDGLGYRPKDSAGNYYIHKNGVQEVHAYIPYYVYRVHIYYEDALGTLAKAYNYTDDIKYGRAGAIILDRYADFFPTYNQTQYGKTWPLSDGGSGRGHTIGRIADAGHATNICLATDAFFPALTDPQTIKFLEEKAAQFGLENDKSSALKIWENWDKNILTDAYLEVVEKGNIMGNYGLYQQTVATAAVIKDSEPESGEMIEWIYAKDDEDTDLPEGGDFTSKMVDVVDRDGMGNETAPNYNGMWLGRLNGMADALMHYTGEKNYNPYEHPKFINMCLAFTYCLTANNQTANVGDGTGMLVPFIECKETAFKAFFEHTTDPGIKKRLAEFLYLNYGGDFAGMTYSIYHPDPEAFGREIKELTGGKPPAWPSEMLTGYGIAIIRGGEDYLSSNEQTANNNLRDMWLYFGKNYGHGHENTLQLGFEVYGLNVAPDPGSPALKSTDAIRLQWVNQSLSHNTVTVGLDGEQDIEVGNPLHFDDAGKVKVIDVEASDAYADTDIYRRTVVMVEVNDDDVYGVDFFRVKGGDRHTYSFHSQAENAYAIDGLTMTEQKDEAGNWKGSYADPEWEVGEDPNSPETWYYDTVYPRGYSWLGKVRRDTAPQNKFAVEFDVRDYNKTIRNGDNITLRLTQMTNFTPREVALVAGPTPRRDDTRNLPDTMDYMLVQRGETGGEELDSLYTTVYEPYRDGVRYVENIETVEVTIKDGRETEDDIVSAVKVQHADGRCDYIVHATNTSVTYNVGGVFDFRGAIGVYRTGENGEVLYRYVTDGDIIGGETGLPARYTGKVADFERDLTIYNYIDVTLDNATAEDIDGKYIDIKNDGVFNGVYGIKGVETLSDGKVRLDTGLVTLIRGHRDPENPDRGYVYNIMPNQTFEIPATFVDEKKPVFDEVSSYLSTKAGSSLTVKLNAESPLGREVTYIGTTLPRGASLDAATGEFIWKPTDSQTGENHVAITARDSDGREETVHFYITVYGSTTGAGSGGAGGGGGGGAAPAPSKPVEDDKKEEDKKEDVPTTPTTPSTPSTPSVDENVRFIDLGAHTWAADAINALAEEGIIKGTSENTFSPASNITRADFALLLVRAFKLESDNTENFADVADTDYFAKELAIARNTGIAGGIGDNKYAPRNTITRQDMMTIVYRALTALEIELKTGEVEYADFANVADYAKDAVSALITSGLVNGKSGKIAPSDYTTRAEVAVLIKRILDYTK